MKWTLILLAILAAVNVAAAYGLLWTRGARRKKEDA
jgi:hypothetical protein